jgi:hypothetical protein
MPKGYFWHTSKAENRIKSRQNQGVFMKNTFKLFGIIAFMAVIGFSFSACGDDKDDGNSDLFKGTWTGDVENTPTKLVAADGKFVVEQNGISAFRGTYTVSGNTASITFTEVYTGSSWMSYDEAAANSNNMPPKNINGTINGNKLNLKAEGMDIEFTKS